LSRPRSDTSTGARPVSCVRNVTRTTTGSVVATFAQYERELIGERTRVALAAKKAQGVQLGRPRSMPDTVRRRIVRARRRGDTFVQIAERLNTEGVPTAQGGAQWYPATVRKVVMTRG
jgi:DNA invertase Pin-like site-specific DNA recombinase